MAKMFDVTLQIMDGGDVMDSYEEEAVRADELGEAMDKLLTQAQDEYNLTDFGFQYSFD